eukprot:ANDGO_04552.mRNA.1 hypothetical protein
MMMMTRRRMNEATTTLMAMMGSTSRLLLRRSLSSSAAVHGSGVYYPVSPTSYYVSLRIPSSAIVSSAADFASRSILVLDKSGSMEGEPIRLANVAVQNYLASMKQVPNHSVDVLAFSHHMDIFKNVVSHEWDHSVQTGSGSHAPSMPKPPFSRFVPRSLNPTAWSGATPRMENGVLPAVVAEGSTDFWLPLNEISLQLTADGAERSTTVVFLTDGNNTGRDAVPYVDKLKKAIKQFHAGVAVHCIGMGPVHDALFLQSIKAVSTASSSFNYVQDGAQLASVISNISSFVHETYANGTMFGVVAARFPTGIRREGLFSHQHVELKLHRDRDEFVADAFVDIGHLGDAGAADGLNALQHALGSVNVHIPRKHLSFDVPLELMQASEASAELFAVKVKHLEEQYQKRVIDRVPEVMENPSLQGQIAAQTNQLHSQIQTIQAQNSVQKPRSFFSSWFTSAKPTPSIPSDPAKAQSFEKLTQLNTAVSSASAALRSPLPSWSNQALGVLFTGTSVFVGAAVLSSLYNMMASHPLSSIPYPAVDMDGSPMDPQPSVESSTSEAEADTAHEPIEQNGYGNTEEGSYEHADYDDD